MKYTVNTNEPPKLALLENNEIASILQNVFIIANTYIGTVPMYRNFGIDNAYQDRPPQAAKALLISGMTEAIFTYEPRIKDVSVFFSKSDTSDAIIILEVTI